MDYTKEQKKAQLKGILQGMEAAKYQEEIINEVKTKQSLDDKIQFIKEKIRELDLQEAKND